MNKVLELRQEWLDESRKQTLETLPDFIHDILNDYPMTYNLAPYAVGAIASAAAWAANHKVGLTGFQGSFTTATILDGWLHESSVGRKLIDYSLMLYPQEKDYFTEKTIPSHIWENLQTEARKEVVEFISHKFTEEEINAMTNEEVCKAVEDYFKSREKTIDVNGVLAHQMKILLGEVPFGYKVKD